MTEHIFLYQILWPVCCGLAVYAVSTWAYGREIKVARGKTAQLKEYRDLLREQAELASSGARDDVRESCAICYGHLVWLVSG